MLADGIYISDLPTLDGAVPNTSVVAVDDGTTTKQATTNQVAKAVVENYTGSSLAGTAQSIKSAIDSLGTDMGDLSDLDTTDKSSLVNAINEVATTPSVSPYDTDPEMDGTASPGESDEYARGDHVHPSDTTKADAEEVEADIEAINTALETKADTDGLYEDMSVGNLISTQFVENKEPYLFRRTGNGKNIDGSEKAFIDKIIGGTVAWNQLFSARMATTTVNGVTATNNNDGSFTLQGTATADASLRLNQSTASGADHLDTYYAGHKYLFLGNDSVRLTIMRVSTWNIFASIYGVGIVTSNQTLDNCFVYMPIGSGVTFDKKITPQIIDLTQAFGTEIADYVYSLEQTTAGAGVAWLKSHGFIDGSYRAFNEGSLLSVKTSAHVMRDENDTIIATYPLDSDLELRGLFKLDASNNLYAEGDVYQPDGSVLRNWTELVFDGSSDEAWERYAAGSASAFAMQINISTILPFDGNIICDKLTPISISATWGNFDNWISWASGSGVVGRILCTGVQSITTVADWRTYLASNPIHVVVPLSTPTTEQADPYANPQIVNPLGTEEYIDTRDVPVPVGHETKYMANLREKIEDLPWDLSMIAPIENGATASQAYAQGKYFLKDNQFCKALTSIASGATFTLNTNYAVTTVANELYTALHS